MTEFSHLLAFQLQVADQIEKVLGEPIPLTSVLLFLFYCPFLPLPGAQKADLIEKLERLLDLRWYLYAQDALFILPLFVQQVNQVLEKITNPKGYNGLMRSISFETHQAYLSQRIKETLLVSLSFYDDICQQAFDLFIKHALAPARQNLLFSPLTTPVDHDPIIEKENSPEYMSQWGLEVQGKEVFPYLEIVIWRALGSHSYYRRFSLPVSLQKLDEDAWDLLGAYLENLEKDESVDQNDGQKIQCLRTPQQEYEFYLNTYRNKQPVRKKGEIYHLAYQNWRGSALNKSRWSLNNFDSLARPLFDFVRTIKIEYRKMILSCFLPHRQGKGQPLNALQLAAEGNIYCHPKGYSLIHPSHQIVDPLFQLRQDELETEFLQLTQTLSTCQHIYKWDNFCTLPFYNQGNKRNEWQVSVEFDPWPLKEGEHTTSLNQVTFKLHCPPTPLVYACKFKALSGHPACERFLRWQLMMLKSLYYRFLLTQSEDYPDLLSAHKNGFTAHPPMPIELSSSLIRD
jgi:hypothetical protein